MIEQHIYNTLHKFRKNPENLEFNSSDTLTKIKHFTSKNLPIECLFPACHGKINNRDLVFSDFSCDLSEYLCIHNLIIINTEVKKVYSPGLKIYLLHIGHFYVDTGLIKSDASMDNYMLQIELLIKNHSFIVSLTLKDLMKTSFLILEILKKKSFQTHFYENYLRKNIVIQIPNLQSYLK